MLETRGTGVPRLLHWGPDLGDLGDDDLHDVLHATPAIPPSSPDIPLSPSILAGPAEGFAGFPALIARRPTARPARLPLRIRTTDVTSGPDNSVAVQLDVDDDHGLLLRLHWMIELSPEGVVVLQQRADAVDSAVELHRLAAVAPLPTRANDILDFSGLWAAERRPQRGPLRDGLHLREQRRGRPGHDAPFLTVAGTPGFGFRGGEVWALHHAWSGNSVIGVESLPTGHRRVIAAELLEPGEITLTPGESYAAPDVILAYSGSGLDGLSERFHPFVRRLSPHTHRPVMLNTWEAVYFDHTLAALEPLVDVAAEVGAERFVLDDGWFSGRTDDRRALGDWSVDTNRWPKGLHPLVDRVRARGMEFGLWVEPEMVSPDSQLAARHPDWMLAALHPDDPHTVPPSWRWQHTLDITHPDAVEHLIVALSALLTEYPIRFLKWDHNRDQHAGSAAAHTRALYRLLDRMRADFPDVAIESCASGGARIDLGIASRVHRFWTSDTNDALERQSIHRYTSILIPPELLGSHVGAPRAHITGRTHDLSFRMITALFGHAGIEWDLTSAPPQARAQLADWVALVKDSRDLLHSGRIVRTDEADSSRYVHGVVATDTREALIALIALASSPVAVPPPLRFPGLDPDTVYRLEPVTLGDPPRTLQDAAPAWWETGSIQLTGRLLAEVGVPVPLLSPEQGLLLRATATDAADPVR